MCNMKPLIYNYANEDNHYFIMREDLLPFSFGGNKVRKNFNYFQEIIVKDIEHVVSYGSKSSNHARIVATLCSKYNLKCTIITPLNADEKQTYNTFINNYLGARILYSPLEQVKETISNTMDNLRKKGEKAYFIQGGAHGLLGTTAYVEAFKYIKNFSESTEIHFDYIFLASGTGATQAGLMIGNYLANYFSNIVGISVARNSERGIYVIQESIKEYEENNDYNLSGLDINFNDSYLCGGYGKYDNNIKKKILKYYQRFGIPLDPTYTGKAAYGMHSFLKENDIENKNILFIHTGGTPLFFDFLKENLNENY